MMILYSSNDMAKLGCNECSGCSECCRGMGQSIVLGGRKLGLFLLAQLFQGGRWGWL